MSYYDFSTTRGGIDPKDTQGGQKTKFERVLKFKENLDIGNPNKPVKGLDVTLNAKEGQASTTVYGNENKITANGPVSIDSPKGSDKNNFAINNTSGEKSRINVGGNNNKAEFNKSLKPGENPSPAEINNTGTGNNFTGSVGDHSAVNNQGANASYGASNAPFRMGPNSSFIGNSNAPNLYFNVDMGPYSTATINTSVVNGSSIRMGENSHFYGGPNLSGNFTIDYTGSTAHSSSTTIDLPGYTKNDSRSGPNGDIYEKHDANTGDTTSEVTVRPPESAGGPHVNTDPANLSAGYPSLGAWDTPLGM